MSFALKAYFILKKSLLIPKLSITFCLTEKRGNDIISTVIVIITIKLIILV